MGSDIYVAVSGATARMRDLEQVANNLANADTVGFKRDGTLFRAALESALRTADGRAVRGAAGNAFAVLEGLAPDMMEGPIHQTGRKLDVAIAGPGFFEVETPAGPRFTRAGSFVIDRNSQIATPDGLPVLGTGGPLRVDTRPVELRASGELVDDDEQVLGRLRVVDFPNGGLEKEGQNLYRPLDGVLPEPVRNPTLVERSVERSNVIAVHELSRLVTLQRAFDAAMETMRSQDRSTGQLLQEIR